MYQLIPSQTTKCGELYLPHLVSYHEDEREAYEVGALYVMDSPEDKEADGVIYGFIVEEADEIPCCCCGEYGEINYFHNDGTPDRYCGGSPRCCP